MFMYPSRQERIPARDEREKGGELELVRLLSVDSKRAGKKEKELKEVETYLGNRLQS